VTPRFHAGCSLRFTQHPKWGHLGGDEGGGSKPCDTSASPPPLPPSFLPPCCWVLPRRALIAGQVRPAQQDQPRLRAHRTRPGRAACRHGTAHARPRRVIGTRNSRCVGADAARRTLLGFLMCWIALWCWLREGNMKVLCDACGTTTSIRPSLPLKQGEKPLFTTHSNNATTQNKTRTAITD